MSELVELYEQLPVTEDVRWWRGLTAAAPGRSVLYGGCGTGRLALPVAREASRLVGVDVDPRMLAAFRNRLRSDADGPGGEVDLIESAFEDLDLEERFGLVILPSNLLNGIVDPTRRTAAVRAAARHCRPDGRVVLQVLNPYWLGSLTSEVAGRLDTDGQTAVEVTVTPRGFDAWEQRAQASIAYRFPDGRELVDELDAVALFPRELRALAYQGGLDVVETWGARPGVDGLEATGGSWHVVTAPRPPAPTG